MEGILLPESRDILKDQNFDLGKSISCWTRFGQTDSLKGLWQIEGQTLYLSPLGLILPFDRVCASHSVAFSCHHIYLMVSTPVWGDAIPLSHLEVCKAGFFSHFRLDCSFVYQVKLLLFYSPFSRQSSSWALQGTALGHDCVLRVVCHQMIFRGPFKYKSVSVYGLEPSQEYRRCKSRQ